MSSSNDLVLFGGEGLDWTTLQWDTAQIPYMMIETAEWGIQFLPSNTPLDAALTILRLHLFGEGGDLLLRHDEDRIYWRFVGERGMYERLGLHGKLFPRNLQQGKQVTSLLWGQCQYDENKQPYRYEGRMGKASLNYPLVPAESERVEIHALEIIDDMGAIVTHWTFGLGAYQEQESL